MATIERVDPDAVTVEGTERSAADQVPAIAVPCVARPYAGRAHLDGPCRCFYGGPAPVFLAGAARILALG
jgi:hypothetical protein